MFKDLPNELKLEILKYLPFEKVVGIDDILAKKKYNPKIHTFIWACCNGHLAVVKYLQDKVIF